MDQTKGQKPLTGPAGGFLGTGAIVTLIAILVLLMIGLGWFFVRWLPSVQSF